MKVLLIQDVRRDREGNISTSGTRVLGWLGDIVEVKDGYARNYLLSQGLAVIPTDANIKSLAKEKAIHAEKRLEDMKRMEKAVDAVNGAEAVVAAKANELGHLFGSVGEKQIAENLRAQGFEVCDEVVRLPEHIKQVGTHEVKLRFADELIATVNVVVVAEGQESAAEQADGEEDGDNKDSEGKNESS